jgi:hypothetical protein
MWAIDADGKVNGQVRSDALLVSASASALAEAILCFPVGASLLHASYKPALHRIGKAVMARLRIRPTLQGQRL